MVVQELEFAIYLALCGRLGSLENRYIVEIKIKTEIRVRVRFKPASNFVLLIVPSRYFCSGSFCFMSWSLKFFVLLAPYVCFHIFS